MQPPLPPAVLAPPDRPAAPAPVWPTPPKPPPATVSSSSTVKFRIVLIISSLWTFSFPHSSRNISSRTLTTLACSRASSNFVCDRHHRFWFSIFVLVRLLDRRAPSQLNTRLARDVLIFLKLNLNSRVYAHTNANRFLRKARDARCSACNIMSQIIRFPTNDKR